MKKSTPKKGPIELGKGFEELETIVQQFETGEIDLEKDIPRFEHGLKLAKQLKERLQEVKNTVTEIEGKFIKEE